jgi:tetratricopeptide (TPR) repeat protein
MRLVVILFLIVIAFVGYLAYLNPGEITFYLARETDIQIPTTALVLLSMAFGGLVVTLVAGFLETRHLLVTWRMSRLKKREERITEHLRKGRNAKASERDEEAVDLFQKALQIDPTHVQTLLVLGDLYRMQGNPQKALQLHRKAKELDGENIEVLLSLSQDLEEALRVDEAILALNGILETDKGCLPAMVRLRELYVKMGRWEKAHEVQEKIVKGTLPPKQTEIENAWLQGIKYELGQTLLSQGHPDEARRYFRACIKLNKDFIPAYMGLGEALLAEKKKDEASKLWGKAYDMTGHIMLLHRLEDFYLSIGQPSRILHLYQGAIEKDPSNLVLQFYLGKLYYRLEMVDEAFETLSVIDSGEGRIPDLHKMLGNLYLRKGELLAAVEEFKKALRIKKRIMVPYYCPFCDFHTTRWSGRCSRCGRWNSFKASPIMGEAQVKTMAKSAS